MTAQHFRKADLFLARRYDELVAKGQLVTAVACVLGSPHGIGAADVPTPVSDALAALPIRAVVERADLVAAKSAELAAERQARAMAANADRLRAKRATNAELAREAERASFIEQRAKELEAVDDERRRAKYRAAAEKEGILRFGAVPPVAEPSPVGAPLYIA